MNNSIINKVSVLLVEDDLDDQALFFEALAKIHPDIKCFTAKNGAEALLFLEHNDFLPNFIFLDLNMPIMDGKTCLAKIKSNKAWSSIPVIIYSTSNNPRDKMETEKLGADYYLTKQILFDEICHEVFMVINRLMQVG